MDWVEEFLSKTETVRSPESFRLWTALGTIAAALERRVWTETDVEPLFPNMYTVLCGGPASGKTIMVSTSRRMLGVISGKNEVYIAPDNPTKASFLDSLEESGKVAINGGGSVLYCAMTVLCAEFGVLISKYDQAFLADLTTLYDNPISYSSPRRTTKSVTVERPTINILAAATPDALMEIIPDVAWGQGFTSRIIFVYGVAPHLHRRVFEKRKNVDDSWLKNQLREFFHEIHGEMIWEPDAQEAMEHWYNVERMEPRPNYGRLVNYCGRRDVHAMKLAMISAISAGHGLTVTLSDWKRAQEWLFKTELTMPDVFKAMAQKSDAMLMNDCHYHIYQNKWGKVEREKRQPITIDDLWEYFQDRVPHERIAGLIEAMERTGRLIAVKGGFKGKWIPAPLDDQKIIQDPGIIPLRRGE